MILRAKSLDIYDEEDDDEGAYFGDDATNTPYDDNANAYQSLQSK